MAIIFACSRKRYARVRSAFFIAAALSITAAPVSAERRGIDVAVVKTDGARIAGELCAVRAQSVVVRENQGESGYVFVSLPDIRFIETAKISALKGAFTGLLRWGFIGTIAGDVIAFKKPSSKKRGSAILGGLIGGAVGAFFGGLKGLPTKAVVTIDIQGQPREIVEAALRKLAASARIRDAW
jgi:hypothetical protein